MCRRGLLAFSLLSCSLSCAPGPGDAARILEGKNVRGADDAVELSGVTVDRFVGDRVRHRARVERARIDRLARIAEGTGIVVEARDRGSVVRAGSGRTELEPKTVVLSEGVVASDREGRTIRAASMIYDVASERAEAPAPVVVEGANFRATGGRLVAWTSTGTVEVEGPLRALVSK